MIEPQKCSFKGMCYICQTGGYCVVEDGMKCEYDSRSRPLPAQPTAEAVLDELAEFTNNPDNTFDLGNAQKGITLKDLYKWMQSKGWQP